MAIHGPMPATHPNQNGVHHVGRSMSLVISISQPKRIIDALTKPIAISAARSVMPVTRAISTIIKVEEMEYSTQRNRLRLRRSSLP